MKIIASLLSSHCNGIRQEKLSLSFSEFLVFVFVLGELYVKTLELQLDVKSTFI